MPTLEGQVLKERYHIRERAGQGAMSDVYKAWDNQRCCWVAVKVMHEDLAEDAQFLKRFKQEAKALGRLSHKNIVRFYDFEREGWLAFIVMDYVEGKTLKRRIFDQDGAPLPISETHSILKQVCAALHYAHQEQMIHRDIKPANILIRPDKRVLVVDFGIVKVADASTLTTGIIGTAAYMSPEQCRGENLDARSDVYSLGIVAYEMLTGRRPFIGETNGAGTSSTRERILWEQEHADPPPLRGLNRELSSELEAVIFRAVEKKPARRWSNMQAFWHALEQALPPEAVEVQPVAPIQDVGMPWRPLQEYASVHPPGGQPSFHVPAQPALDISPYAIPDRQQRLGRAWMVIALLIVGLIIFLLAVSLDSSLSPRPYPPVTFLFQSVPTDAGHLVTTWPVRPSPGGSLSTIVLFL